MRVINPRVVLFALNNEGHLDGLGPVKRVKGCYTMANGERVVEESYFLAIANEDSILETVLDTCTRDGQESILVLDENREASLVYCMTGDVVKIGQWIEVDRETALSSQGYTYDYETNKYYTVR